MAKHLIIIGGGAAGFFCAVNAARFDPDLKVTLLEKTGKLLSKVRVSGGGRCNVTHQCSDISEMSARYPRGKYFVRKAFHQFFTLQTIEWFEQRGVPLKTEADGRMFPVSDSSQTIIDCLMQEALKFQVEIKLNAEVKNISCSDAGFIVELSDGAVLKSEFLTLATGGYPKHSMFGWIRNTNHQIESPVPSLFTFNLPAHPICRLMGVSVEKVNLKVAAAKLMEEGPVLITHWGLSGPAILRLSAWGARELAACNWKFSCTVNWAPDYNEQTLREFFIRLRTEAATQKISNRNKLNLPARLWEFLLETSGIGSGLRWADLSSKDQNKLAKNICLFGCEVQGKTTFKEEFVTAGGIRLSEVDANTMMSKNWPNLFFAGEVLDVDGITGGYNFQHAWTSGFIAAKTIASISKASEVASLPND